MKKDLTLLRIIFFPAMLFFIAGCQQKTQLSLPAIFSDNLVLQQNTEVTIWGKAIPGTSVSVAGEWGIASNAVTAEDSTWQVKISTKKAGGPYKLNITAADTSIQINNVMLGEVWLASGQSNMEMPLKGWLPNNPILNSEQVIANSENRDIRMFTVSRNMSSEALDDLTGSWKEANPDNAGLFSATAYFFARKLNAELGVPVGIIHSSWGGTPIEAWISKKKLSGDKDFIKTTKELEDLIPQARVYNKWLSKLDAINILPSDERKEPFKNLDVFDNYCSTPETDTKDWPSIQLPTKIEQTEIGEIDGVVWFRKQISIPESWEEKELTISLGPIDDMDVTFFNGQKIGGTEVEGFWQKDRYYTIPAKLVKSGTATIAVKVIDTQGGGGIYGSPEQMMLHPNGSIESRSINLAGEWQYKVVGQISGNQLFLFNPETNIYASRPILSMTLNSQTPTVLYNAMIAPLTSFTLKGTIWYQGEANVERANQYMRLMKMLITDWRSRFENENMPFYFVQLAPWNYNNKEGISSANLREAQRRSLSIPNTGMAVTLDIGDVDDIHPANKTDVGERLAFWALTKDYGKDIPCSGPIPGTTEQKGNTLIVNFENASDGLSLKENVPNQFEVAGKDGKFYSARVRVDNNRAVFSSPRVSKPVNVRYAYKNGAEASLFNGAGLPAPSFTTEDNISD
jgi:sialate O-acetylesterase